MKRNRLKEIIALAVCACTLAGTAATAQESSSAYTVGSLEAYDGSFVVNRFGLRDGRLVAYGRLVPSDMSSSSSFDASALGNWTGIGTGYGESGRESRSTMVSDNDGPVSMSLVRPSDDVRGLDVRFGPTSGNDRVASGIDVQMGATSGNDRTALSLSSSSEVVVPVTIVSASCDAVSLSFAGSESVVVSASPSSSDDVRSTLCAVADARESALVSTHLNRLIGE